MKHSQDGEWEKATIPALIWNDRKILLVFALLAIMYSIFMGDGPMRVLGAGFSVFLGFAIGTAFVRQVFSNSLICPCGNLVLATRVRCRKCSRAIPSDLLER